MGYDAGGKSRIEVEVEVEDSLDWKIEWTSNPFIAHDVTKWQRLLKPQS